MMGEHKQRIEASKQKAAREYLEANKLELLSAAVTALLIRIGGETTISEEELRIGSPNSLLWGFAADGTVTLKVDLE